MTNWTRTLVAIWLAALALRATYLWEISHAPFFDLRLGDAEAYHVWARGIADGDWVGHDAFYQAPLYPYFLALVYLTLGDSTTVVRAVQAVLGASSCALLGWAGMTLFGRAGAGAGVLLAVYPSAIYFDGLLEKSSLVIFLTAALIAAIAIPLGGASIQRSISVGAVLGFLVLTRENAILLAPVCLARVWTACGDSRGRVLVSAAFVAGLLATLVPVGLRNLAVAGEFHLTTSQFGPNFYIGNHPRASGTYEPLVPAHGSAADERQDATDLATGAAGRALDPGEVSRFWTNRALDYIRAQPTEWLRLLVRKLALTFNSVEIADTESRDVYAEWSVLLRVLSPFGFGSLLALAGFATVLIAPLGRIWWLYTLIAAYALSVTMFYVLERYRVPIVPTLMVIVAGGFAQAAIVRTHVARGAIAFAAAMLAFAFAHLPLADEQRARAAHYSAIGGVLSRDPTRLPDAVRFYQRAIDDGPDAPAARFGLGTTLVRMSRFEEAIPHLQEAVRLHADYPEAHYNLGIALVSARRPEEAIREYESALRLRPHHVETRLAMAKTLLTIGEAELALRRYEETLERDPKMVAAIVGRGVALTEMGHTAEALGAFTQALQIAPNEPDVHNNLGIALAKSGRIDQAVLHFERALALNPGDHNARRNLDVARGIQRSTR